MIYLDNAATTSPKPASVIENLMHGIRQYSANPGRSGHDLSLKCAEKLYDCRKNISSFFGLNSPERCIFTYNCTTAVNMALKGTLRKGDHVIISDIEHNAVVRPLNTLASFGVEVSRAHIERSDAETTLRNFEKAIKSNTRLIFCTHTSNVTGDVLPISELSALANKYSILFGIDAAQSGGCIPIDQGKLKADFICLPSHKGLYGIMGCGALLLSERVRLRPLVEGGTGSSSLLPSQPDEFPERLESGTVNLPGVIAMSAGVDFVRSRGISEIFSHEINFCTQLEYELSKLDSIRIVSCRNSHSRTALTTFIHRNLDSETIARRLSDEGFAVRGGYHCAPDAHRAMNTLKSGAVRISPSCFTSDSCIPMLVNSIKKL